MHEILLFPFYEICKYHHALAKGKCGTMKTMLVLASENMDSNLTVLLAVRPRISDFKYRFHI